MIPQEWTRVADPIFAVGGHLSPQGIAPDTSVVRYDATGLRMYFTAHDSQGRTGFAMAESPDGLNWATYRKPTNPDPLIDLVLAPDPAWGVTGLETICVVRRSAQWRAYYTEYPNGGVQAIGLSTSADGVTWTRTGRVFLATQAWEQGGVLEPSVLYDPVASLWKLWYAGIGEYNGDFLTYRIGYATSRNGVNGWKRQSAPVLNRGEAGAWDELWASHVNVVYDSAGYHLFYFGTSAAEYDETAMMQPGCLGYAQSLDGINWTRYPTNPILQPRSGMFDAWAVTGPCALIESGVLRLYYSGFSARDSLASNVGVLE